MIQTKTNATLDISSFSQWLSFIDFIKYFLVALLIVIYFMFIIHDNTI